MGVTGMAENKGIFWSVVQLGAAALERDLSTFGLVEHDMHPTIWQRAELAVGTAVSSPKHTLLKCAQKYRTMSSICTRKAKSCFPQICTALESLHFSLLCHSDFLSSPACEPQHSLRDVSSRPFKASVIFPGV